MNNQLYYEKLNVSAATDIEKAYKEVVANNKKFYRCKTASGKIIGWNVATNRFISSEKAEELYPDTICKDEKGIWFINAEYKVPEVTTEPEVTAEPEREVQPEPAPVVEPEKPVETPKEVAKMFEQAKPATPNIASIEDIKRSAEKTTAVFVDMIKKYTNTCNELENEKRKNAEKEKIIAELQKRVKAAEKRADDLDEEEESAVEKLDELREAVKTFVEFYRSVENER